MHASIHRNDELTRELEGYKEKFGITAFEHSKLEKDLQSRLTNLSLE